MDGKEQSVALGVTREPVVVDLFNIDRRKDKDHQVTAVLIYLGKWGSEPQVKWRGTNRDLSTTNNVVVYAQESNYSVNPTETDYTEALKKLVADIKIATPGVFQDNLKTIRDEVKKWRRNPETRGFRLTN